MKTRALCITCCTVLLVMATAKSQISYHFPTVYSPVGCAYTYEINITLRLDSVKITNVYFDDGVNGSFAYEAYISYQNIFSNSTLPPGTFFTYDISLFSDNLALSPNFLTNNAGNVPLQTFSAGGFPSQNNPTFNGSASQRSLVVGNVYTSNTILLELGYDSATLRINLPCLDTLIETDDSGTLPVLWSQVVATAHGQQVSLAWQTFTEQNNAGFTVQKSGDGSRWQNIGFLRSKAADGNSNETLSYLHTETQPWSERWFYRVMQQDIDGRSELSNIVSISLPAGPNSNQLLVYPNPSPDLIYLRQISTNTKYVITDNSGRVVLQGHYARSINISQLTPGIYWVHANGLYGRFAVVRTR